MGKELEVEYTAHKALGWKNIFCVYWVLTVILGYIATWSKQNSCSHRTYTDIDRLVPHNKMDQYIKIGRGLWVKIRIKKEDNSESLSEKIKFESKNLKRDR